MKKYLKRILLTRLFNNSKKKKRAPHTKAFLNDVSYKESDKG